MSTWIVKRVWVKAEGLYARLWKPVPAGDDLNPENGKNSKGSEMMGIKKLKQTVYRI